MSCQVSATSTPCAAPDASAVAVRVEFVDRHGERRHVVGPDAGHDASRNVGQRVDVEMELLLVHPQHVPAVECLGNLGRHGAEVLADDGHARRRGTRRDHGEDLLARVVHVRALVRGEPGGNPPQAFDCHGVVDPQDVGMAADAGDELAPQSLTTGVHRRRAAVAGIPSPVHR